ncbi:MAG: TonB-dependent receptor [Cyclobacteriaceae bacterium]
MKNETLHWLTMVGKTSIYVLVLAAFLFNSLLAENSRAQNVLSVKEAKISISLTNEKLEKAINVIEGKTNYTFVYNPDDLDDRVRITVNLSEGTVEKLLLEISRQARVGFLQVNERISVKPNPSNAEENQVEVVIDIISVTGKVTDEDNEALPGATVLEMGTTNGTITDINGNFSLSAAEDATLIFSYVGYRQVEVPVNGRSVIDVKLLLDVASLDEIVVVGYGTVKKSDLTGSVSSISAEDLTAYPSINPIQALQGRTAGLQIRPTSGEPGASYTVRIRGASSINAASDPIYVVDGFVGGVLPPAEDIESIEVLKDASATAIYGSRGANGVIMVTTKRGKEGEARIDFNASYSLQDQIKKLDVLNREEFIDYHQELSPGFVYANGDTDWQEAITRTGKIQNYQLSVSGGSDKTRYYLSGVYYDQEGIVLSSEFNRVSLQSNIDVEPVERVKFGANLFLNREKRTGISTSAISTSYFYIPALTIYNEDGTYASASPTSNNPYATTVEPTDERLNDRMQANVYGELTILDGLIFRSTFGASSVSGRRGRYTPTTLAAGLDVGGNGMVDTDRTTITLNENYLSYTKQLFDLHSLNVVGGYSYQKEFNEFAGARGSSYITDAFLYWNLGSSTVWGAPTSGQSQSELTSWYGRVNYSFSDRYLLTFTTRYDGSSTFSENHKWALFPSGAIAWNAKNEAYMQDISWLSQLKIRASYGKTGNQAINPYQTLARFSFAPAVFGSTVTNGVKPTAVANNNLTWETTNQTDLGADIGVLEDRITVTADYYIKNTKDLLFELPLPQYSGYGFQLANIGEVENRGFEFALSSRNLVGKLKWNMAFNISFNQNKVLKLPDGEDILYSAHPGHLSFLTNSAILKEGEPVGMFYGHLYNGVYQEGDDFVPGSGFDQEPGGERYRDINGRDENGELTGEPDGMLNNDDRTIIGNPHPDFIWGWTNSFNFGGFDLNLFFQGSQGNDIFSYSLLELGRMNGINGLRSRLLNRWSPENTDTNVPSANPGRTYRASDQWVFDGSYIRLKNISLGYTIPNKLVEKAGIRRLRIYVSAQNVLTISDYPGVDPEVNYQTNSAEQRNKNVGFDYGSYPNAKSFTVGLNLGF